MTRVSALAWRDTTGEPITLDLARHLARYFRCEHCAGRLIIDHDDDPQGNGRLHCLLCGLDVAGVKVKP